MMKRHARTPLLAAALMCAMGLGTALPVNAAPVPEVHNPKQDYENRLASVGALAGALRRDAGKPGVAEALAIADARSKDAIALAGGGNYDRARAALEDGYRALKGTLTTLRSSPTAIHTAPDTSDADATTVTRQRNSIDTKIVSTRALVDALKRLNAEKKADKAEVITRIEADTARAQELLAAGRTGDALALADDAYVRAKATIASLQTAGASPTQPAGTAADGDETARRQRIRVEAGITSTQALSDALRRQNAERKGGKDAEIAGIDAAIGQSRKLLDAGRIGDAHALIDDAYERAKAAIAALQTGNAPVAGVSNAADTAALARRDRDRALADIATTKVLLDALRRQNSEKHAGKATEIANIASAIADAERALAQGDVATAQRHIGTAYPRAKLAIAGLQAPSDLKSGSAALAAAPAGLDDPVTRERMLASQARRRDSIVALLDSGKRVAAEKQTPRPELAKAESLLAVAADLSQAGRLLDAGSVLDEAYRLARETLRDLRGGDKLVADKRFASRADEYRYELARNDDYLNLIAGVIKAQPTPSWEQAAAKARSLRVEAEAKQKAGDVDTALSRIEESTLRLKAILRDAGFPII